MLNWPPADVWAICAPNQSAKHKEDQKRAYGGLGVLRAAVLKVRRLVNEQIGGEGEHGEGDGGVLLANGMPPHD